MAYTGVPDRYFDITSARRTVDELRIIMVGALTREKQPQVGVQVLAALPDKCPARLRMVGAGNLEEATVQEARRLGVEQRVELIGSVEDIGPHLEWADVLLLTSSTEGLPGVVLEAAAAGVPAVAFDVGGTSEAIADGLTGFVVPDQDVAAGVDHLVDLAEHPDRLAELGEAARRHVEDQFRMSHAVGRYAAVLESAIQSRQREGRS